jgi:hypothetical protein
MVAAVVALVDKEHRLVAVAVEGVLSPVVVVVFVAAVDRTAVVLVVD